MTHHRRIEFLGIAGLVALWLVAWTGMRLAAGQQITPEKVIAFVEQAGPLKNLPADQRLQVIDQLADRVNAMTFEQRRELRFDNRLHEMYDQMTDQERNHYLDRTLPQGMTQMMDALNKMTTQERQKIVRRALDDLDRLDKHPDNSRSPKMDDPATQRIINEGMHSFFRDASAETKIDFEPVIEQMQKVMQNAR